MMMVMMMMMMKEVTWTEGSSSLSLNALSSRSKGCRTNIIVTPLIRDDNEDDDDFMENGDDDIANKSLSHL